MISRRHLVAGRCRVCGCALQAPGAHDPRPAGDQLEWRSGHLIDSEGRTWDARCWLHGRLRDGARFGDDREHVIADR